MKILSFGNLSLFLLFPFLLPIFACVRTVLESLVPIFPNATTGHPFFISFLIMASNFLMGIPLLIIRLLSKKKKKMKNESIHMSSLLVMDHLIDYPQEEKKAYKGSLLFSYVLIFLISLSVSVILFFNCYLNTKTENILINYRTNIALLFLDGLFSFVFLKYSFARHQIVAMVISIIGIILVCLHTVQEYFVTLQFLGVAVLVSAADISEKWLMEKKYFSPLKLIFLIGCFGMGIFFVVLCITSTVKCPESWAGEICTQNELIEPIFFLLPDIATNYPEGFLMMFLIILIDMGYLIFFFFTNYYFSPCHRCMSDIVSSFFIWVYFQIFHPNEETVEDRILSLFGYLIITFGAFIYNEIIILYVFNLHQYTKKEINLRGCNETVSQNMFLLEDIID